MQNTSPLSISCLLFVTSCFVFPTSSLLWAGEVVQVIPLSFGVVDINPAGCSVTLDSRSGGNIPASKYTVISGGNSGKITIRSSVAEQAHILYSNTIKLFSSGDDNTIVISDIQSLSQYNNEYINLEGGNLPLDIHIGGKLILNGDESVNEYSGKLKVNITFSVL